MTDIIDTRVPAYVAPKRSVPDYLRSRAKAMRKEAANAEGRALSAQSEMDQHLADAKSYAEQAEELEAAASKLEA